MSTTGHFLKRAVHSQHLRDFRRFRERKLPGVRPSVVAPTWARPLNPEAIRDEIDILEAVGNDVIRRELHDYYLRRLRIVTWLAIPGVLALCVLVVSAAWSDRNGMSRLYRAAVGLPPPVVAVATKHELGVGAKAVGAVLGEEAGQRAQAIGDRAKQAFAALRSRLRDDGQAKPKPQETENGNNGN